MGVHVLGFIQTEPERDRGPEKQEWDQEKWPIRYYAPGMWLEPGMEPGQMATEPFFTLFGLHV